MTDVTIPTNQAELEEMLLDQRVLQQLNSDPKAMATWIANYQREINKNDPEFQKRVDSAVADQVTKVLDEERPKLENAAREELDRQLAWRLKDEAAGKGDKSVKRLDLTAGRNPTGGVGGPGWGARNALFNQAAPGARIDHEDLFPGGVAEYLQTIWHNQSSLPGDKSKRAAALDALHQIKNDYGSTIPADGGFLIPESLRSEVMMIALEMSITRPRATVIPMESLSTLIPAVDSTSNASSVFGGIVCYWAEEGSTLTESQGKFRRVKLEAKKLTAYAQVPNELVADATAFGAFFNQAYPRAMAFYEDDAFINGTGAGEPFGWANAAAAVEVANESGQPADTIFWENIVKAYARMLPTSLGSAEWVVSPDTFPELATMALSVGTGGSAVWLTDGTGAPRLFILGRPVNISEKVPVLGDAGDVNFVDLSYYAIGDRQTMQAESSTHAGFRTDTTDYRFIQRVDGRPLIESSITPKNGGAALSPFVKIAARA